MDKKESENEYINSLRYMFRINKECRELKNIKRILSVDIDIDNKTIKIVMVYGEKITITFTENYPFDAPIITIDEKEILTFCNWSPAVTIYDIISFIFVKKCEPVFGATVQVSSETAPLIPDS